MGRRKNKDTEHKPAPALPLSPSPPLPASRSPAFLAVTILLLVLWIAFLTWVAIVG